LTNEDVTPFLILDKKRAVISTIEITALQQMKEAGTGELYYFWAIQGENPLHPFKQFSEEIRDRKQVSKNQCPDHHPFNIDLDPLNLSSCFNTECLILVHFMLRFPRTGRAARFCAAD
jgi:hypothetical protein